LAVVLEFSTLHFRSSLSPGSMVVDVRSDFEVFFFGGVEVGYFN
jgi:hypothetical protein